MLSIPYCCESTGALEVQPQSQNTGHLTSLNPMSNLSEENLQTKLNYRLLNLISINMTGFEVQGSKESRDVTKYSNP